MKIFLFSAIAVVLVTLAPISVLAEQEISCKLIQNKNVVAVSIQPLDTEKVEIILAVADNIVNTKSISYEYRILNKNVIKTNEDYLQLDNNPGGWIKKEHFHTGEIIFIEILPRASSGASWCQPCYTYFNKTIKAKGVKVEFKWVSD
jgi:hypothetical protein